MKLLFVGDVMLGRLVNEVLKKVPPDYPWGDTLPLFKGADLRLCNLECVLSDWGEPWNLTPKVFHFRSDAKNVAVLKEASINVVSLANNHTLDYGYEAMQEMLTILDKAEIKRAGAGKDAAEASQPAIINLFGMTLGFLAFTDNEPAWAAKQNLPGIYHVPTSLQEPGAAQLLEHVKRVKEKSDFLIVSAHWGPNWGYRPQAPHVSLAHALIDHGADLIFGHSCHVFQGIEIHKNRPILYSTGDFVDDYAVDEIERNDQSFIFVVEIQQNSAVREFGKSADRQKSEIRNPKSEIRRLLLYPTVIREFQARLAQGKEREEIASKMRKLCAEFGTAAHWQEEGYLEVQVRGG